MGPKSNSKTSKGNKQNGSKSNGGKLQSQQARAAKDQNGESEVDYSMLRKPIELGRQGVTHAMKIYQSATPEVRELLQYECDIIYECKVCRNLFRSLANFISHKRVYCREQYCDSKHYFQPNHVVEDLTTIIQPQPAPVSNTETWATSDATPIAENGNDDDMKPIHIETSIPRITSNKNPKKDLSQIVEKLAQQRAIKNVTETVAHISASKFYNDVKEQLISQRDARKENVVHLEAVENTQFGVFQTVMQTSSTIQMENTDLMKAQVVELHTMMTSDEATLGPEGVVSKLNGEGTTDPVIISGGKEGAVIRKQDGSSSGKSVSPKENHVCSICKTRFSTRKTLNHHMKSLHVTFRMCYPCPCCKNTFCNTWSVYRHLYKVHRKTTLQVRKLRSQIVNKAFRKEVSDETLNAKSNAPIQTEADKARKEQQRLHQENQAWMNNFEDDLELQMCGGCGRRFERRAALNSHSQICQKRIAVQNNIKSRRTSPTISTSTTSCRVAGTKVSPPSLDRHNLPHTETSRSDSLSAENANRLTPLSVQSESGLKCIITPSPSPVPLDQFLTSSPSAPFHRTRHCSGSSVVKKDIPEKRIEIQIRRDYCKAGTSSSGCSGSTTQQHDCNSESNENALPNSDAGHEDESSNFNEDSKLYQSRELGVGISRKDNDTPTLNVCRYPGRRCAPEIQNITIDDCDNDDNDFDDASSVRSMPDSGNRSSNQSDRSTSSSESDQMRRISVTSEGQDEISLVASKANSRRASDNSNEQEDIINALENQPLISTPPTNSKKEEHFSPIMERRMQNMIYIQRLQCLPCQKKFNKLTNLRRHVAVHMGWNRYRCTECPFKCFSKYDCVAHVNKLHLEKADRDKAQSMVQYIETQVCDSESEITNRAQDADSLQDAHDVEIKSENLSAYLEGDNINKNNSDWSLVDSNDVGHDDDDDDDDEVDDDDDDEIEDIKSSSLKQGPESEGSIQHTLEMYGDKQDEGSDVVVKEEFTVTKPLMTYTMRSGKGNETLLKGRTNEVGRVQGKSSRGRPRKRCASTDAVVLGHYDAAPPKKLLTSEYQQNIDTSLDVDEKPKISEMELDNTDNESAEVSESPEDSPRKIQDLQQQTALRKMVLQVIFGAGSSSMSQDMETSENMFALTMNGEAGRSGGSASSPEPYDIVEAVSSDSTSPLTTTGSTSSPVLASDDAVDIPEQTLHIKEENKNVRQNKARNSVTPTFEIERRQRPVRNRIKVEREDFIYDLSDRCLDPKRDDSKMTKRKQQESVKVLGDKGNNSNDGSVKLLPKLMLVRTNVGEYSGVKMVKSGSMPQALDCSHDKNAIGYNISTRKSQRTFDISPHKTKQQ